jgi:hypothetical protein
MQLTVRIRRSVRFRAICRKSPPRSPSNVLFDLTELVRSFDLRLLECA